MPTKLTLKTKLTNEGLVIFRDETRFGLHRACIEAVGFYPDLEAWSALLGEPRLWLHRYSERVNATGACICHLWLYWKE